jgi:hypothetical protein
MAPVALLLVVSIVMASYPLEHVCRLLSTPQNAVKPAFRQFQTLNFADLGQLRGGDPTRDRVAIGSGLKRPFGLRSAAFDRRVDSRFNNGRAVAAERFDSNLGPTVSGPCPRTGPEPAQFNPVQPNSNL